MRALYSNKGYAFFCGILEDETNNHFYATAYCPVRNPNFILAHC